MSVLALKQESLKADKAKKEKTLIKEKYGRSLKVSEIDFLLDLDRIQDKLPGRAKCSLTFKNNLVGEKCKIKYLKLGHVLEGQEVFIYERMNIDPNKSVHFDNYIIGTNIGHVSGDHEGKVVTKKITDNNGKQNNLDADNIYDRLYIQFVIEKVVDGFTREYVYNQSYSQFLKEQLIDLFAVKNSPNGKAIEEMLDLVNIQLYFDPKYNTISKEQKADELRLKLAISIPTMHTIYTDATIL